jgi:hypothetical protein
MKNIYLVLVLVITSTGILWFCPETGAKGGLVAQKKVKIIAYPARKYIKKEGLGLTNDWVVEIDVPENSSAPTPYCDCDRSQPPFRGTEIYESKERGVRMFRFIAGKRAQITSAYSFEEWARAWRVSYYAPAEPRGPDSRPRRP